MRRRIRELSQQELEEIRVGTTGGQLWSRVSYAVGGTPGVRPAALLYLTSVGIGVALFLVA